jgi:hypothetical protein
LKIYCVELHLRSAGVSPAIFLISPSPKYAGETPALLDKWKFLLSAI